VSAAGEVSGSDEPAPLKLTVSGGAPRWGRGKNGYRRPRSGGRPRYPPECRNHPRGIHSRGLGHGSRCHFPQISPAQERENRARSRIATQMLAMAIRITPDASTEPARGVPA